MNYFQARLIASSAFAGKTDKAGKPYTDHLDAVEALTQDFCTPNEDISCIALLHDLLEDTSWTAEMLYKEGFSEYVVKGVEALTRQAGESYSHYIVRLSKTPYVIPVKLADLTHNMDVRRLPRMTDKDLQRLRKYHRWFIYLKSKLPC